MAYLPRQHSHLIQQYRHTYWPHQRHFLRVRKILNKVLKEKKCKFFTIKAGCPKHIMRLTKLKSDKAPCPESLRKALWPTNKCKPRFFSGFGNIFRRLVDNVAQKGSSLHKGLKANCPKMFTLTNVKVRASRELFDVILSPPAPFLIQVDLFYSIKTDTSAYGI